MLKVNELSHEARELFGNRCRLTRSFGPRPQGNLAAAVLGEQHHLYSKLAFTAPVVITSVSIYGPYAQEQLKVALTYDQGTYAVLMARDLKGNDPYGTTTLTFLSPVGMAPRDDFCLYVSSCHDSIEFVRLEIAYYASDTSMGATFDVADLVTFEIDGRSLKANKFALAAASPKFKAQLFGDCKESTDGVIHIKDSTFKAFEFFLALLVNVSSDQAYQVMHSMPMEVDMVEVYALADYYCATVARSIAEAAVLQRVNQESAVDLLQQCKKRRATQLANRICDQAIARLPKEGIGELLKTFVGQFLEAPKE